jgi:hypothetical protein
VAVDLDGLLKTIDLFTTPALDRSRVEPPDSGEYVDHAHNLPGSKRPFSRLCDTVSKANSVLLAHSAVEIAFDTETQGPL